jgi:hypothetical protein
MLALSAILASGFLSIKSKTIDEVLSLGSPINTTVTLKRVDHVEV